MKRDTPYRKRAVALAAILVLLASRAVGAPPDGLTENEAAARDLVRAALESEVLAGPASRASLLKQALDVAPDYPPARWHAGYISFDGKWLTPEQIQQKVADDGRRDEYRRLRQARGGSFGGELFLARWCRKQGLDEEAKYHWLVVVQFQPRNKEALSALGMRWDHGRLLTHAEIAEGKQKPAQGPQDQGEASRGSKYWEEHWGTALAKWQRAFKLPDADLDPSIHDQLQAIRDPVALGELQALLQKPVRPEREREFRKALSLEVVGVCDSRPEDWSAVRLASFAVDHPDAEVRKAAADALVDRPLESYVPMLLARMQSPLEADFVVYTYPDGGVSYQHTFYREGLDADFSETRNQSTYLAGDALIQSPLAPPGTRISEREVVKARSQVPEKASRARAGAMAKATQVQDRVRNANAAVIQRNRRIQAVLTHATGVDRGANPIDWQKWWRDRAYEQLELEDPRYAYDSDDPQEKPVYKKRSYATRRDYAPAYVSRAPPIALQTPETPRSEPVRKWYGLAGARPEVFPLARAPHSCCLPQGTPVWTLLGPLPIEEITAGDRVLSQDPESGELAYRMVLETTTRNPTDLVDLGLGSETITSTRGHPFWVDGQGWRMAKQIEAGMPLHTLSGAMPIDRVDQLPAPKPWYEFAHNLVVDDFHTYFVGRNRLLAHDNTPFPSDESLPPVPGLKRP